MKRISLLAALEEKTADAMPVNDTEPLNTPNPLDPASTGTVENVVAAESDGSMPKNDTDPLNVEKPLDPNSDGKVVSINTVEKGKETESGIGTDKVVKTEVAQEDNDDTVETVLVNTGDFERETSDAIDQVDQLNVIAQENEDILEEAEFVGDAHNELEALRDDIDLPVKSNELNGVGAEILNVAVESIQTRYGLTGFSNGIPSMESYSTPSSRARSAKIALEDVEKKTEATGEATISRLAKFKNGLLKLFGFGKERVQSIQKRAKFLRGEYEKVKGKQPAAKTLGVQPWTKRLAIDGQIPKDLDKAANTTGSAIVNLLQVNRRNIDSGVGYMSQLLAKGVKLTDDDLIDIYEDGLAEDPYKGLYNLHRQQPKDGKLIYHSDKLLGGAYYELTRSAVSDKPRDQRTFEDYVKMAQETTTTFVRVEGEAIDAHVLSDQEIELLLVHAERLNKFVDDFTKFGQGFAKATEFLEKAAKVLEARPDFKFKNFLIANIRAMSRNMSQPTQESLVYMVEVYEAILHYIDASIKARSGAAKPGTPQKPAEK